ncbi:MAG: FGGY-family carbohydrate kinase [Lachnospiraceae bacterium]|nr:FGGY-family carbohydrate kinase [Lachnospiraceae bacterium]
MRELLLGIDIGTSSCKVAVFTGNGEALASRTERYSAFYPKAGWAEQDPDDWWHGVVTAVKGIFGSTDIRPEEIAGIGVDGQSWSAVAVDREGNVLCPTPIWMDTRAGEICKNVNSRIGADRIFDLCGNPLQPMYTTPKVLWYREERPELYRKIDKILQCNGFIVYRLTGAATQDISQGYGWHMFDMRKGCYDAGMAKELGIPESFLPDVTACDAVAGRVTKAAAEETGLKEGTPVVAGGLDACCGALGAGVLDEGETQEQGGQAGGMSICMKTYHSDPRLILSFHVTGDSWLLQGGTTGGGGVMRWFESEFCGEERMLESTVHKNSFEQINESAAGIPAGSEGLVFLPYMAGERSPIWDPFAKGVFYGIDFSKKKAHFIRACMEGTAYALKHNIEVAEKAGAKVHVLKAIGGAANSHLWTQIKADVTGKKITVPASDTATTWGACMLAGKGIGMFESYEDVMKKTVSEKRAHEPDAGNAEVYEQGYKKYRELYENLKDTMKN